ncbi:MAG: hypothetical protein CBD27_10505 [Rhodospirillaceae bacterium TMED167]|nr:hypothetical protein [Rhodospirillaceae bacterium]OUW24880.1 MAG: hypothetical protein CBD27_10505 [Rhodospirillaceae bacterium TMED167]
MALNPAAAHVNSSTSSAGVWEAPARGHAAGPAFAPQARQGSTIDLRHTSRFDGLVPDARGGRITDGFRRNIDEKFAGGGDPRSSNHGFYGDYWDASLAVFSIAAFEAQLFAQDGEGSGQPRASHSEGIQWYRDIKTVLERALAVPTDADDVVARNDDTHQVNLLA